MHIDAFARPRQPLLGGAKSAGHEDFALADGALSAKYGASMNGRTYISGHVVGAMLRNAALARHHARMAFERR